jgi:hypothetical protein
MPHVIVPRPVDTDIRSRLRMTPAAPARIR